MYTDPDFPFFLLSLLAFFFPHTSFYFLVFLHPFSDLYVFFILSPSLEIVQDCLGKTRIL